MLEDGKIPLGLLSAVPMAAQAGLGIYQTIKGNRLANSMNRPVYNIPQEILDNLTDSQIQALRGMPAEQKQQYIDNVMRSQQASFGALGDRKAGLAGIAGVQQNAIDGYRNMLSMDAQQRQTNEQALQGVRSNLADYKDKEFQMNQMNPYQETMQAAEAMKGAGIQNLMGGVTSGSKMGLDYGMFQEYMNRLGSTQSIDGNVVNNTSTSVADPIVNNTSTAVTNPVLNNAPINNNNNNNNVSRFNISDYFQYKQLRNQPGNNLF